MYRVYYKYSWVEQLVMNKGDLINECNQIEALSKVAEVYYGHRRYLGNYRFADRETPRKYDVQFIRANKEEHIKPKAKKRIWVASPYDAECFKSANVIATFTDAWAYALQTGMKIVGLNPLGRKFLNARSIGQCLGKHFEPRDGREVESIRKQCGGLVIGHFGRISATNYPYLLQAAWGPILKKFGKVTILAGSTNKPFPINTAKQVNVKYMDMPTYLSACDMVILGQHGPEWGVCGNLKVKEAAACGVPVILEQSAARIEELGAEYPLFLPAGTLSRQVKTRDITKLLRRMEIAVELKQELRGWLVEKMQRYTIQAGAARWKKLLKRLVK